MFVLSVLAFVFVLPTVVTGRIPLVDGVFGGVPHLELGKVTTLKGAVDANAPARTPGKLRVVENSGVCGKYSFSTRDHGRVHNSSRNYTTCLSSLRIWGYRCEPEHLVCVALRGSVSDFNRHSIDRFWFFAARKNPETAPLITWFNGGVSGADWL